jgi:hypothetical protein
VIDNGMGAVEPGAEQAARAAEAPAAAWRLVVQQAPGVATSASASSNWR